MKRLITIVLAISFVFAFANSVKAQVTKEVTVTATVLQVIEIDPPVPVNFGNVQTGAVAEINAGSAGTADPTASSNSSEGDAGRGSVTITGGTQDYIVSQTTTPVLALNGTPATTLAFIPRYHDGTALQTLPYTKSNGGVLVLTIGGQLANPGTAGSYSTANDGGTVLTLSVAYSSI